jgi:Uncharacterized protein conserved in bacteria
MEIGRKYWVFADGDLPPHGDREPLGHEALMITNAGDQDAVIDMEVLFSDKEPKSNVILKVPAKRVIGFRLDYPIGEENYQIPFGQYALVLKSNVPVVMVFGRLDRRKDCAYYEMDGYSM